MLGQLSYMRTDLLERKNNQTVKSKNYSLISKVNLNYPTPIICSLLFDKFAPIWSI